MDFEKYYDRRKDSYVIHFPNFRQISVEKLEKMFSAYGPATIYIPSGRLGGLVFVRFKNLDDTINCINGFKDHKSIKILPHKNKSNGFTNENGTNKKQNLPKLINGCNSKETIPKQSGSNNSLNRTESDCNTSIRSTLSMPELLRKVHMRKSRCSSSTSSDISLDSDQNSNTTENISDEDEVPALTYRNKLRILPAQEIVIANIDPRLGVKEIFTLLNDYYPLATTSIMIAPKTDIRYLHAYFATVSAAIAVEKRFDKYMLSDRILIALRPEVLRREAIFM